MNMEDMRHEVMVAHVEQEAKRAVPDHVKAELLSQIKSILQTKDTNRTEEEPCEAPI